MKPERWQKIDQLLEATLELPVEQRAAFLAEACAGDETLRQEVEALLRAEEQGTDFLEAPAVPLVAAALAEQQARSLVGEHLGAYKILAPLGKGGMGEVYLAQDTRLGRKVALKLLPAQFTEDTERVRRFEQEGRAASALNHPNIITIHDIGQASGTCYIATELIEGQTLRQRLARGAMALPEALDVAEQIATALAAAHAASIVHRDIKPENIMVREDGYVKVLDFGLAKLTEHKVEAIDPEAATLLKHSTEVGVVMGTVRYMSPEQARGQKVDARSDIFSLGVVLYEMIAGQVPFAGVTMADVMAAILEREPAPLTPPELQQIVQQALRKDRAERYQTSQELLHDLKALKQEVAFAARLEQSKEQAAGGREAIAASEPSALATASVAARVTKEATTPPALAARAGGTLRLGLVALLLMLAGTVGYVFYGRRSSPVLSGQIKSLAVLPLKPLQRAESDEYLSLGITDAIITRASQMGALVVRPMSAVQRYSSQPIDPLEAARQLQVDAVLESAWQRLGNKLRLRASLLRASDGVSLWVGNVDREMNDLFALQDDIAQHVAKALEVALTASEEKQLATPLTKNPAAYDAYLRGKFYRGKLPARVEDLDTAINSLEQATTLDPNFALAYVELAQTYHAKNFGYGDSSQQLEAKVYVALEKALGLNPNLAEAYQVRGSSLWTLANGFPYERAAKEYQRALALNPNLAAAHSDLGSLYDHVGLFDKALAEYATTLRLDPSNQAVVRRMARIYANQQKYELAMETLGNDAAWADVYGLILWHLGRTSEALAVLEKRLQSEDAQNVRRSDYSASYAVVLASLGQQQKAAQYIQRAIEAGQGTAHFHHAEFSIACTYALLGKNQRAVEWLQKAAEHGLPCYPLFENEPALKKLKTDPQYVAFMEKLKQRWEGYKATL